MKALTPTVYLLYRFLYVPWKERKHYQKYPNVEVTEKFYPFLGDLGRTIERKANNEYQFYDYIDAVIDKKGKDFKLIQMGTDSNVDALSIRAIEEVEKLIPDSIDRDPQEYRPIWYAARGSILLMHTTEYWKTRRTSALKLMNLNILSEYLPLMIESGDSVLDTWNIDEHFDITGAGKKISMKVISKILIGRDYLDNLKPFDYHDINTGECKQIKYEEFLSNFADDGSVLFSTMSGYAFPFLKRFSLINPYKSVMKNSKVLFELIKYHCEVSKDKNSVYNKLGALGSVEKEHVGNDIIGLIMAGTDTTASSFASGLYFIKRFPKVHKKLMNNMDKAGLSMLKSKNLTEIEFKDLHNKIQECDYLNYFVKEQLRIDSPGAWSINYKTKKDVTIGDVMIPKGTNVETYNIGPQNDPSQWHGPREFIPERFDPESEYFFKPGQPGVRRHPKAWIPFSSTIRTGPGKVLSTYEIKAVIARLLNRMEYEVDQDLLQLRKYSFSFTSQHRVKGKILSKSQ